MSITQRAQEDGKLFDDTSLIVMSLSTTHDSRSIEECGSERLLLMPNSEPKVGRPISRALLAHQSAYE
jgi:hypothetical protein